MVQLSKDKKQQAVIELSARKKTSISIVKNYGVDRASLYNWKKKMLDSKDVEPMAKVKNTIKKEELLQEIDELSQQAYNLKRQVHQLQLEKDILEKVAEVIKKTRVSV